MGDEQIQSLVMDGPSLEDAHNKSSAVMGRIRKAKKETSSDVSYVDIEDFIFQNEIDEKAANALREQGLEVQQVVMDGGSLANAKNKSSAVMGRLRKAKFQAKTKEVLLEHSVDPDALEEFISQNEIDEKAASDLRGEDPLIQQAVMQAGSLEDARNKSSAVVGRIIKAKKGMLLCGPSMTVAVRQFISENDLDDKASQFLLSEHPHVQQAVMEIGSLETASNKSSALMGRIIKAKKNSGHSPRPAEGKLMAQWMAGMQNNFKGKGGSSSMEGMMMEMMGMMGMMGMTSDALEMFIMENGLDERAAKDLRAQSPLIQQAVMNGGSLVNASNPSSAVVGRIRSAKKSSMRFGPY